MAACMILCGVTLLSPLCCRGGQPVCYLTHWSCWGGGTQTQVDVSGCHTTVPHCLGKTMAQACAPSRLHPSAQELLPRLTRKGEALGSKKIHSRGVLRSLQETAEHTALGASPAARPHVLPLLGTGLSLPETLCSHLGPAPGPPRSFWRGTRHLCNTHRNPEQLITPSAPAEKKHTFVIKIQTVSRMKTSLDIYQII